MWTNIFSLVSPQKEELEALKTRDKNSENSAHVITLYFYNNLVPILKKLKPPVIGGGYGHCKENLGENLEDLAAMPPPLLGGYDQRFISLQWSFPIKPLWILSLLFCLGEKKCFKVFSSPSVEYFLRKTDVSLNSIGFIPR